MKECQEIVPLFVFDEPLLRSHVFGSACVGFMLGCLEELRRSLALHGVSLAWRMGDPIESVMQAASDFKVDAVYWNRDYEPAALERDRTVQQRLAQQGRTVRTFKDHVVFEAEEVRGLSGDPFQRYSAYRDRWWAKWRAAECWFASSRKNDISRFCQVRSETRHNPVRMSKAPLTNVSSFDRGFLKKQS